MSAPPLSDKENASQKQRGAPGADIVVRNDDPRHTSKASSSARSSFSRESPGLLSSQLVLRRGEALEELFGIPRRAPSNSSSSSSRTMESYRALCESIVGGGAAVDDAQAWRDVLDMASRAAREATTADGASSSSSPQQQQPHEGLLVLRADFNLLRLHRRATSRPLKPANSPAITDIWLSYAACQLSSGLVDDAKLSLRHVQQILVAAPDDASTGGGGGHHPADHHARLADLLVRAGCADGAVQALEAGWERHGGSADSQRSELARRLARLRAEDRPREAPGTPPAGGAISAAGRKRRTPLSSLEPPKRGRTDAPSALEGGAPSPALGEAAPLDLQAMKRRPLMPLQSSKPPSLMKRSTSDDQASNGGPGAAAAEVSHHHHQQQQQQQQRLSQRVPSKHSNVPLLPKLSAYSSVNAGRRSSSPSTSMAATTEAKESRASGTTLSVLRTSQSHGSEDPSRHWSTPTTAVVTAEARTSMVLNQSNETATDSAALSTQVLGSSGNVGIVVPHRRSHCGGDSIAETTPSRPPLGLRSAALAAGAGGSAAGSGSIVQPTSASRYPTLLDRISRGGKRMDGAQSTPSESDGGPQGPVQEPKEGGSREEESTTRSSHGDDSKSPPRKVNMDISYMWEWDPNRVVRSAADATPDSPNASTKLTQPPKLEPIKEDETAAPPASSKRGLGVLDSERRDANTDMSRASSSEPEPAVSAPALSEAEAANLLQNCSRDFLPLMSEANVLRVNSVPYLKLGVIGKGGSCKVYRALTKNCSVVAIKKVKLAGMERKAISGYANEVALLKRLRGNPAIIQMIDSQLDLKRKQLLVVMEQGETDLNHILHQQALSSATRGQERHRQLNMNFIRLTWHQMLSAVHCIHEARIVHGDLKPANFLFVKGALKLIDFGIAKAIQSEDTTNVYRDTQIGTLNYMSPEAIAADSGATQRNGAPRMKVGRASDIWSLGCILYQMVYGQTPFADLHMIQKLHAIINPNHAIAFPERADKDAIDAMQRCLRRRPEERAPIVGPGGLLNEHRFLHPHATGPPPAQL